MCVPEAAGGDCSTSLQAGVWLKHTETLRWGRRRRRREEREWHLNRQHFFTEQHRWVQPVSQSVTQKRPGPRLETVTLSSSFFHFAPSLFLEADEEEVASRAERPGFRTSQQDASGRRTHSGGRDEDATVFCGERSADAEWNKPHVSWVYLLKSLMRFKLKLLT